MTLLDHQTQCFARRLLVQSDVHHRIQSPVVLRMVGAPCPLESLPLKPWYLPLKPFGKLTSLSCSDILAQDSTLNGGKPGKREKVDEEALPSSQKTECQ